MPIGRPAKDLALTEDALNWIKHRETLVTQVGLNLEARAQQANTRFGLSLKKEHLRALYKSCKITKQKMQPRLGGPKLKQLTAQKLQITRL